jgi:GrpB-like predicted nucleotidyltransferase (UPF0157 family)
VRIRVVPHDPDWKQAFDAEAEVISQALGDVVAAIHHIGSTAIPGIPAKPIIDILLEVGDIARLDASQSALEQLGYEGLGEFGIPGRRYFRKDDASGKRTHQIHAFQADNPGIGRHFAFRDYLIAHPEAAQAYGILKQRLALVHPNDIQSYMDGKDAFIKEHQAKALVWWGSIIG